MVKLSGNGPYVTKDQRKADKATKFIGRGSSRSSTNRYAADFGALANSGQYTKEDVVFVSAEGARGGRINPDFDEIARAVQAEVAFVTDDQANRIRTYNIGERQVAEFLKANRYREVGHGVWHPGYQ